MGLFRDWGLGIRDWGLGIGDWGLGIVSDGSDGSEGAEVRRMCRFRIETLASRFSLWGGTRR